MLLPTNIDETYPDDPTRPDRKLHQQYHDALQTQHNTFEGTKPADFAAAVALTAEIARAMAAEATKATPAEVSAAVAALVDASPATLDTLNELAAALGNDPNFATTITALIASKATPADITAAIVALALGPASKLAVGTTAGTVAAGDDGRLSDQRVPTDGSVVDAKVAVGAAIAESKLALASDAAANVASRRTLGTGATQATAGTDARLSDARTPTAHRATHGLGGSDALTTADLASGTPDATTFLRGDRTWVPVVVPVTSVNTRTGDVAGLAEDNAVVHLTGAELITGLKTFQSSAATAVGLLVKGVVGQTADLQQWQNSAGTVLAKVDAAGAVTLPASTSETTPLQLNGAAGQTADMLRISSLGVRTRFDSGGNLYLYNGIAVVGGNARYNSAILTVDTVAATLPGIVVRGVAAQTADLQQWQNSAAATLVTISSAGQLRFGATGQERVYRKAAGQIGFSFRTDGLENGFFYDGGQGAGAGFGIISNSHAAIQTPSGYALFLNNLIITGNHAGVQGVRVTGAAGQTADLQQWQDSAGSVLARLTASGVFSTNGEHYTNILSFITNSAGAPTTGKTWHVTPSGVDLVFVRSGIAENIKMLSAGDMEFLLADKGVILKSTNGTRYRLTVADDGALTTAVA